MYPARHWAATERRFSSLCSLCLCGYQEKLSGRPECFFKPRRHEEHKGIFSCIMKGQRNLCILDVSSTEYPARHWAATERRVSSLCSLCLCGYQEKLSGRPEGFFNHEDTKNTKEFFRAL